MERRLRVRAVGDELVISSGVQIARIAH
jgi:hypothetical protein